MEDADERSRRAFQNLNHLAFPALTVSLFACHADTHHIPVKGTSCPGGLDEHIVLITFHYYECKAFTGHLHLTHDLREHLFFLSSFSAAPAA